MSDIFLSYARQDLERAKAVASELAARGWDVWWDRTAIRPGQIIEQVIQQALDEAQCVVVLWSRHSIRSEWVMYEAREGRDRGRLIPALLDEVSMPLGFRSRHAANLVGWQGDLGHAAFEELAGAVEEMIGVPAAQPAKASVVAAPASVIQPAAPAPPVAGQTRENPKDGLTYVWIPPGKFMMGCSPNDSECSDREKPPHEVTITRGFWLGQTPVTAAAYARFLEANGKEAKSAPADLPVVNVDWDDAKNYCTWAGLRLPTEAEWEYAARAGTAGPRYGDLDDIVWHFGNSKDQLHSVRGKQPNARGLYDMLGNVWEWVADWYGDYSEATAVDPAGPSSGQYRVLRGGSRFSSSRGVRASFRNRNLPTYRIIDVGFRCAGELR